MNEDVYDASVRSIERDTRLLTSWSRCPTGSKPSPKRAAPPPMPPAGRTTCPDCGGPLRTVRDGIFAWKACRRPKSCGWDVFK